MSSKEEFLLAHGSAKHIDEYLRQPRTVPFGYTAARKLANNPAYGPEHAQYLLNNDNYRKRGFAFYIGKHFTTEDMDKHVQDPMVAENVLRHSFNPKHFETFLSQPHRNSDIAYALGTAYKRGAVSRKMIDFALNHESENIRHVGRQLEEKYSHAK